MAKLFVLYKIWKTIMYEKIYNKSIIAEKNTTS